ncbi:MAG: hypothetical protein NXI27_25320 [Alphaproteobacteria bacterium]|nr:hypothetical protein [Alphaproteobacteria bacterium]
MALSTVQVPFIRLMPLIKAFGELVWPPPGHACEGSRALLVEVPGYFFSSST